MTIHHGVDLVAVSKLRDVCERHENFIPEVFTQAERDYCLSKKNPYRHLAGRFAAKEACMKALGRGLHGTDSMLREIEVVHEPSGKPSLRLTGFARKLAARFSLSRFSVSISHTEDLAVSTVVLSGEKG